MILDEHSFEQLFRELYPELLRYCIQIVRDKVIAEEIVQEKFIQLWERRKELKIHSSYKSFLFTAVKNKSIDHLRLLYKKPERIDEKATFLWAENPQQNLEFDELSNTVTKAVENLPEKCFAVFSLKRYGELSNKEISEKLNISQKTVEAHLITATKKIKAFLVKSGMIQFLLL